MKKVFSALLVALLLFGLVACGGGQSSSAVSDVSGASDASADTSAAGGKIQAIQDAGELVMLTNATFPPFEYVKNNEFSGVDVELAQLIADELGVPLRVVDMDFDLLTEALNGGKGDIVAAGMSITEERQLEVDFSTPYVDARLAIVVPVGSDITSPDQLAGQTIAVQEATTSDMYVSDNVDATVLQFKDAVEAGSAVINGKATCAVIDELTAQNIVDSNPEELMLLDDILAQEQYAMAVAKGDEEFLALVNKVLEQAVADDVVNQLIAKHMGEV